MNSQGNLVEIIVNSESELSDALRKASEEYAGRWVFITGVVVSVHQYGEGNTCE